VLYDGKKLIGAAPAYVKTNSEGEFIFDWAWADLAHRMGLDYYPKLVIAAPFTPATGHRVLWHPSASRDEIISVFAKATRTLVKELGLSSAHVLFPEEHEAKIWAEAGRVESPMTRGTTDRTRRQTEALPAALPRKTRTGGDPRALPPWQSGAGPRQCDLPGSHPGAGARYFSPRTTPTSDTQATSAK